MGRHRTQGKGRRLLTSSLLVFMSVGALCQCKGDDGQEKPEAVASEVKPALPAASASSTPRPISTIEVDHGELDTAVPSNAPKLASTVIAATVYKLPDKDSRRLGYIRLGGIVPRDPEPVAGKECKGKWYHVYPMGYVCTEDATIDLDDPLVKATARRPDVSKPLPYRYGFVRSTSPQYLRVPTKEEQLKSEFKLEDHLQWFADNRDEVQRVTLGANDVPLDDRGIPKPGLKFPPGHRLSPELTLNELFGGDRDEALPFWLKGGKRLIPNVSGYEVPDYAVFADRVRRKTGLSFVGAFNTDQDGIERRFAITVDMRLIPTTRVKPDSGSPFHGLEVSEKMHWPFAWVIKRDTTTYKLIKGRDEARPAEPVPRRALVPLSGKARIKEGRRFYQTLKDKTRWLRADDLGIASPPPEWPEYAKAGTKWIDISLAQQTLILYEGKRPWYATLISSGRDRFGDPKESLATPMGDFQLQSKHIAAAMDSEENSTVSGGKKVRKVRLDKEALATIERLKKAKAAGKTLSNDDERRWKNIQKGRHPEYGVTRRRGSSTFELRDVPWIQYFASGFALHGAYWHDVFGIPRSHGCVNLSPIDARIVFNWTDPPIPEGWHGINIGSDMGEGTHVHIRK